MEKITIAYVIQDSGDGEAYVQYFLTSDQAEAQEEKAIKRDYGWILGSGTLETFKGSDVHMEAINNLKEEEE